MNTAVSPSEKFPGNIDDERLEIFGLIWLDANAAMKESLDIEQKLRSIINYLKKFQDIEECQQYIEQRSQKDRIVLIVSGQLGRKIVPSINKLRQIISIYVFCMDKKGNEEWASKFPKVKAVIVDVDELISRISADHKIQKKVVEPLSINFFTTDTSGGTSTTGVNGQFVFSQVLIDCLLRLKYTETDKNELIDCCKHEYEGNNTELDNLRDFENGYSSNKVLWWYTRESFFYETLNAALHTQNIHMIFLFRAFIFDIHQQLQKYQSKHSLQVYRSQMISSDEFKTLKKCIGQFISVNSFFSTSTDRTRVLSFLHISGSSDDIEQVLFEIDADPKIVTTKSFAEISKYSDFPEELEVLFMIGSIFRLESINRNSDQIWVIRMTLCGEDEHDLKQVVMDMKQQNGSGDTNLRTLAKILSEMGNFYLAESYYERLLKQLSPNDSLVESLYEDLGELASQSGDFDKSMQWYQKSLVIKNKNQSTVKPNINPTNNNNDHRFVIVNPLLPKPGSINVNSQENLNQMKSVMKQMYELQEYTTPRYFFILPVKHHDWTSINTVHNWFQLHYKLYFLCECSDDPTQLHIAPHDGYSIKKPREFIARYGSYIRTILDVVEVLLALGSVVIPQLANASTVAHNNIPSCFQSSANFDDIKEKVKFVGNLLDHINNILACADYSISQQEKSRKASLQGADLRELESYLELVDFKHSLGNLYRTATIDGDVRWVCLTHYNKISYNNKMSEYTDRLEAMGGKYNHKNKEAFITQVNLTSKNVKFLSEALTKGFTIVNLVFNKCSIYEGDLDILLDVIMNRSSIRCLKLTAVDVRNWFNISKYICEYMMIHFMNQSLKVRFCDYYKDGNTYMLVRLLLQNKIHRTLDFSACDFFGHEAELQRCLSTNEMLTELIVNYSNNIDLLNAISTLKIKKLQQLKLNYSLCLPSVSSHFCEMLKKNETLVEIDIMDPIGFCDETFMSNLLSTLREHKSIKQLSLHICNVKPSNQNETCLIDSLSNDKFISRLCISQSVISHKLTQTLIHASRERRSLTYLEFYNSQIDANDVSQLQLLYNNESLIHLIISEQPRWHLVQQETNSPLEKGEKVISSSSSFPITINTKWKQHGSTIAGGNGDGNRLNQLSSPCGIYLNDNNQTIYITDCGNDRIVEWKYNASNGQVVAGGNGRGNQINQLNEPTDVIVDEKNNSFIICDRRNKRTVRWSRQNNTTNGETIISDIDCSGLTMDNDGNLYVSDGDKNEVRRWKIGDKDGIIVAGGNGKGNNLNQLSCPTSLFVDENHSIYVSDRDNHRVMKWMKDVKEGIIVAGGQGPGNGLKQLYYPQGVFVDQWENIYVVDCCNDRIMRWSKGSKEGLIVIGGNGSSDQPNQLCRPDGLSFDQQGNIYVVDQWNNRVQKFLID